MFHIAISKFHFAKIQSIFHSTKFLEIFFLLCVTVVTVVTVENEAMKIEKELYLYIYNIYIIYIINNSLFAAYTRKLTVTTVTTVTEHPLSFTIVFDFAIYTLQFYI